MLRITLSVHHVNGRDCHTTCTHDASSALAFLTMWDHEGSSLSLNITEDDELTSPEEIYNLLNKLVRQDA